VPQPPKFGLFIGNSGPLASPELIRDLTDEAERRGFDGVWTNEHPMPAHAPDYDWPNKGHYIPGYAAHTTLSYLAGRTKRVRLGCSVHPLPYHSAIWLARQIATLDQLSDGRAILGTGVGWNRQEMEWLGFPDFEERGAYADEALEVIRALWTEKTPAYSGRWHNFGPTDFEPKPRQQPHPPIWVGGESMPAIRRVARFGTGWILSFMPLDWIEKHLAILRKQLAAAGRPGAAIEVAFYYNVKLLREGQRIAAVTDNRKSSSGYWLEGPSETFIKDLQRFRAAGVTYPIVRIFAESHDDALKQLQIFDDEVRPHCE
jgi:probable F420-dependent oxidoreductase